MQRMASKMLSLTSYGAEYGNISSSDSSCTFMRTHNVNVLSIWNASSRDVHLAPIVLKAGQPAWLVVQYDAEDNE
jgi:hypothetical protein